MPSSFSPRRASGPRWLPAGRVALYKQNILQRLRVQKAVARQAHDIRILYYCKNLFVYDHDKYYNLFQKARAEESSKAGVKRKRLGGSEGWVAVRRVLEQMAVGIPPPR